MDPWICFGAHFFGEERSSKSCRFVITTLGAELGSWLGFPRRNWNERWELGAQIETALTFHYEPAVSSR